MEINLEHKEDIQYLATGLAQLKTDTIFVQAALAVGDGILYFYSDNTPDAFDGNSASYKVKRAVPYGDIKLVILEKIKNNPDLSRFRRIRIICGDEDSNCAFYFNKKQRKSAVEIYNCMKYKGLHCRKASVDLSPLY